MAPARASRVATHVFLLALSLAAAAATPSCQNTVDGVLTLGNSSAFVTYGTSTTVFVQGCNNTVTTAAGEMVIINGNNNTVANNSYGVSNTCGESCPASFVGTCTFNVIIDVANSNVVTDNVDLECAYLSRYASGNVFKFNDVPFFTDSSSASDNTATNNTIGTHIKLTWGASSNVVENNVATYLTDSDSASGNTVVGNTVAGGYIGLYTQTMNNTVTGNTANTYIELNHHATNNTIRGNIDSASYIYAGTDASDNVISLNNATFGRIADYKDASGNTITGNAASEIEVSMHASHNVVSGNMATNHIRMHSLASGNTVVGNEATEITDSDGASNNTIQCVATAPTGIHTAAY